MMTRSATVALTTVLLVTLFALIGPQHASASITETSVFGYGIGQTKSFVVSVPQVVSWECTLYDRMYPLYSAELGCFAIYDPSGVAVVSETGFSGLRVSHRGSFEVTQERLGTWQIKVWGTSSDGGGSGSVTYDYLPPPSVSLQSPLDGAAFHDTALPLVQWSFADSLAHTLTQSQVQFCRSSSFTGQVTEKVVPGPSTATTPPVQLADSTWYWRVRCQCSSGAWSGWTSPRSFVVATNRPEVSVEEDDGLLRIKWKYRKAPLGDQSLLEVGTSPGGNDYLSLGTHESEYCFRPDSNLVLYATVRGLFYDGPGLPCGPVDLADVQVSVGSEYPVPIWPSDVSSFEFFDVTYPQEVTWTASATRSSTSNTCSFRIDGHPGGSVAEVGLDVTDQELSAAWNGAFTVTASQVGSWLIDADAMGDFRNTGSATVEGATHYRRNIAPSLNNLTPAPNQWTNDTTPTVSWTYSDPEGHSMAETKVSFSRDATFPVDMTVTRTTASDSSITFPEDRSLASDGVWYWRATVRDQWGATYTYPVRVLNVDTAAPSAPMDVRVTQDTEGTLPDEDPKGPWRITWKPATDPQGSGVKGYWVTAIDPKDQTTLQAPDFIPDDGSSETFTYVYQGPISEVPDFIVQTEDKAGNLSPKARCRFQGAWAYDGAGNRTWQRRNGVDYEYSYDEQNRLTSVTATDDAARKTITTYTYDANGNQTEKKQQNPDGTSETWSYSYDIDNQLVEVRKDNVVLAAYAYDIFGRRIRAAEGTTLTVFLYSNGKVIYEERYSIAGIEPVTATTMVLTGLTPTGATDYVRAGETPLAKFDLEVGGSCETVTYYHADHLGSTRLRTDALGNLVGPEDQQRMDYELFGALLGGYSIIEPYAYTGQRADASTGLYYYGARFYDPVIGRFITADSWTNLPDDERGYMVGQNPGGHNPYAYVLGNPVLYNDPTGHREIVTDSPENDYKDVAGRQVWTGDSDYDNTHAAKGYDDDQREAYSSGRSYENTQNALPPGDVIAAGGLVLAAQGVGDIEGAIMRPYSPNARAQMRAGQGELIAGVTATALGAAKAGGEIIEKAVLKVVDFATGAMRDFRLGLPGF